MFRVLVLFFYIGMASLFHNPAPRMSFQDVTARAYSVLLQDSEGLSINTDFAVGVKVGHANNQAEEIGAFFNETSNPSIHRTVYGWFIRENNLATSYPCFTFPFFNFISKNVSNVHQVFMANNILSDANLSSRGFPDVRKLIIPSERRSISAIEKVTFKFALKKNPRASVLLGSFFSDSHSLPSGRRSVFSGGRSILGGCQGFPNHNQTCTADEQPNQGEKSHSDLRLMVIFLQAAIVGVSWIGLSWLSAVKGLIPIENGDRRPIRYFIWIGSFLTMFTMLFWPIMSVMSLE